ncbi:MAG: hypothetical protein ABI983_05825 [Acidobacteriota bacterium]
MSKRRLTFGAAGLLAVAVATATPGAQAPTLDEVLKRTSAYVSDFRKQLSGIVAEETYFQEIADTSRAAGGFGTKQTRTLKSDLLLVRPADVDRYVELRDVFELNGEPVRDRQARLETLLGEGSAGAQTTISAIITQSARYNLGNVVRNINTPLMALTFLDAANQERFKFKHVEKATPVFGAVEDKAGNDAPVFRVSTEMWTIEYQEHGRDTIIRDTRGRDRPAHGRFWVNPNDGSVLISELIIDTGGVIATITVSYQSEPLMGFLVPVEMRETYIRYGERISGRADYGKFRAIKK